MIVEGWNNTIWSTSFIASCEDFHLLLERKDIWEELLSFSLLLLHALGQRRVQIMCGQQRVASNNARKISLGRKVMVTVVWDYQKTYLHGLFEIETWKPNCQKNMYNIKMSFICKIEIAFPKKIRYVSFSHFSFKPPSHLYTDFLVLWVQYE